jgi:hypothetical protein
MPLFSTLPALACLFFMFSTSQAQTTAPPAMPEAPPLSVNVVNPEDLLDYDKTIIVPTAYVSLAIEGKVGAVKQSGLLQRGNATANARADFKVLGIDKAFGQAIAKAAQDDFVSKLRAAGYKVLTFEDIRDRDGIKRAERVAPDAFATTSEGGYTYATFAPSDEQHFKSAMAWGLFNQFISAAKPIITDATLVIPQYTLQAPHFWAETSRGYSSVSAEVKQSPGMNLVNASTPWMGKPKSRISRGMPGIALKGPVYNISSQVGSLSLLSDNTPQVANAVSTALNILTGAGNIQRSSQSYTFQIDPQAYTEAALKALGSFNSEAAKSAAEAKP